MSALWWSLVLCGRNDLSESFIVQRLLVFDFNLLLRGGGDAMRLSRCRNVEALFVHLQRAKSSGETTKLDPNVIMQGSWPMRTLPLRDT
jgi:hypothetical protein